MTRHRKAVAIAAVALVTAPLAVVMTPAPAIAATRVIVDPAIRSPEFNGWGTSLAWSANYTGDWANRDELADLLFSTDMDNPSLGLTLARYNIGGGDAPEFAGQLRPGAEVPGYRPDPAAGYDWDADPRQRWWLQAAKERVPAEDFAVDAIAYSAPYWMTQSGRSIGNVSGTDDNLLPGYEDEFAGYLTDVVEHFAENEGIEFRTLSPLNEPSTNYWSTAGRQEGMHVSPGANQAKLLDETKAALEARDLDTGLSAVDETSIDLTISDLRALEAAGFDFSKVEQVNAHTYSGGDRASLFQMAVGSSGKRLQMSEVTYGGGAYAPDSIGPSLVLASALTTDMKELQPSEWVYWQALESEAESIAGNGNWGLVHYTSDDSEQYSVTRKFHTMRQYTNFIRPGATFIRNSAPNTVTALNEAGDELTIVTFNNASGPSELTFDLSAFAANGASAQAHRTSQTEARAALAAVPVDGDALTVSLPGKSISTFVVPVTQGEPKVGNGDFETGAAGQNIPGWLTWGGSYGRQITADYTQAGGISTGALEAVHYGSAPYHVRTYQTVEVPPGRYVVKAEARTNGGAEIAQVQIRDGESVVGADVINDEAYNGIETPAVEILDGSLEIALETKAAGGRWVTFDNVSLERVDAPLARVELSYTGEAIEGQAVDVEVQGFDEYDQAVEIDPSEVSVSSSVATDTVDGLRVLLSTAGSRTLSVSVSEAEVSATIEVVAQAVPGSEPTPTPTPTASASPQPTSSAAPAVNGTKPNGSALAATGTDSSLIGIVLTGALLLIGAGAVTLVARSRNAKRRLTQPRS